MSGWRLAMTMASGPDGGRGRIYSTANGGTEAVVRGAKTCGGSAERAELAETLAMIRRSEADLGAGRVRDARVALRRIARRHGVMMKR